MGEDTREGEGAKAAVHSARSVQQQQQQRSRGSSSVARFPFVSEVRSSQRRDGRVDQVKQRVERV